MAQTMAGQQTLGLGDERSDAFVELELYGRDEQPFFFRIQLTSGDLIYGDAVNEHGEAIACGQRIPTDRIKWCKSVTLLRGRLV